MIINEVKNELVNHIIPFWNKLWGGSFRLSVLGKSGCQGYEACSWP